jgi:regulator of cell morphogenesis and NO signaling
VISPAATVAELVVARPGSARVFERLGLDYCCGGKRSLAEACRERGLDVDAVAAELERAEPAAGACEIAGLSNAELCEHVVSTHHDRLREELPRLSTLLDKVVRAHGEDDPRLVFVRAAFSDLRAELEEHIGEEERVLFPAIAAGDTVAAAAFEDDHERAGALLERLSELTDGYDLRGARCNTHRATLTALAELQLDLHQHIHEENNVLFPRAATTA